ncbi:MAG: UvrD-helicase domain-containing protein [Ignavibacteriales bacterium]
MAELYDEKQRVINAKGNILVTVNPGTGKTLLLAHKFLSLVQNGLSPERILCLTFTDKAKREMEDRIIELLHENGVSYNLSKLNIYTFHSFALDNIEQQDIISSNLLRFSIYKYLKDKQVFNYYDSHLVDTIVPKIENLIRYLKSFGITPDKIDIERAKSFLNGDDRLEKDEIDRYDECFVQIFAYYEKSKAGKGLDYADMLINFLKLRRIPQFDVVLVDELQDVNKMEADIALRSGKEFVVVGDKKQAIFGFQGGSIVNFKKFENSSQFILSQNFRSADEILRFAREHFVSITKETSHRDELKDLQSAEGKTGERPVIYGVKKDSIPAAVCALVQRLIGTTDNLAIIARTNYQITEISRELTRCGINFSSTFFTASTEAKSNIIKFLRGVLSNDITDIKNAMFTPFFPISLQRAFENSGIDISSMDSFCERCSEYQNLRNSVRTVEDVNILFREKIIPVSIVYGKEYLLAALKIQNAFQEALDVIEPKTINNLMVYLETADLLSDEFERESQIVLTTVHKAKGKQFDTVIYVPTRPPSRSNFQDEVVKAILKCNGINVEEELEEETLRINFVAFTRAKNRLFIFTDGSAEFLNEYAVVDTMEVDSKEDSDFIESRKRAYACFVNGEFDKARELLNSKRKWLCDYVKSYFDSLHGISFSSLSDKPYDYFMDFILQIKGYSPALSLGSEVHSISEKIVNGSEYTVSEELLPYEKNLKLLVNKVKGEYPEVLATEYRFRIPLYPALLKPMRDSPLVGLLTLFSKEGIATR